MKAMEDLDGTIFQGRLIQCLPAKRPPAADATLGVGRAGMEGTGDGDGDGDGDGSVPRRRLSAKPVSKPPETRGSRRMRERTARRGTPCSCDRMPSPPPSPQSTAFPRRTFSSLAIRTSPFAALGEAQIAETKEQLAASGVNPARLEAAAAAGGAAAGKGRPRVKRSSTAIVLKNLPYEAEESDLRAMCERFGGLARLALPDTKAIAVAEWLEPAGSAKGVQGARV